MRRYMRVVSVLGSATSLVMSVALLTASPVEANASQAKQTNQVIVNTLNADATSPLASLATGGSSLPQIST